MADTRYGSCDCRGRGSDHRHRVDGDVLDEVHRRALEGDIQLGVLNARVDHRVGRGVDGSTGDEGHQLGGRGGRGVKFIFHSFLWYLAAAGRVVAKELACKLVG